MNPHYRKDLERLLNAGIRAVAPDGALLRHVRLADDMLFLDETSYALAGRRIVVLGAGKGVAPMARAVEDLLGNRISRGLVVTKYGHGLPLRRIRIAEAGHPTPDAAGEAAAESMLELARSAGSDTLVLCLITGGASSLTTLPPEGVSLADMQQLTEALLRSGAAIQEINAIRKHLSRFSGGRLAQAAQPAQVVSLIVSDVIGDDPGIIASGPTAPDSSTFEDCMAVLQKYGLVETIPQRLLQRLQPCGQKETPGPGDPVFAGVRNVLIATNGQALEACAAEAAKLGYVARVRREPLCGEARIMAVELIREACTLAATMQSGEAPLCLVAGGETTVTLAGNGLGGRNQEMALAAALALEDCPIGSRIAALFAGTDGTDGPTDAAGGFASVETIRKIRRKAEPEALLAVNDSYHALTLAGDLLRTGPTRTNVMDLALVLVFPPEHAAR